MTLLNGIRARLLGLVFATVLPLSALVGFGLWNQWKDDEATAMERSLNEARLLAAQVDDHINNLENLLTGLSRAVSTRPIDASANDTLLRRVKQELPGYVSNLLLFSLDGTNIGNSWSETTARPYGGARAYFRQVLAGKRFAIGDVVHGSLSGQWVVTVARPVEDENGRLKAVLAIGTRLEHFQEALKVKMLPDGSVVRILNEEGIVIARTDDGPNWIGRNLSESEDVARHIAAKEASDVIVWPDGIKRITSSTTAHRAPWLVTVGLPTSVALGLVAQRAAWNVFFIVAAFAISFMIAWSLSLRIVRPLTQLGRDAAVLAAGWLSHRTAVKTRDEVGVLADTFNQMATSLERREDEAQRSAHQIRETRNTLAAVIDASPVAIVCSDLERNVILWNQAAFKMFGYSADEAVGRPTRLVPDDGMAESAALFQCALNGETLRDVLVKRKRKDGSLVDIKLAAAPMLNLNGTVRGVAWAYEDITNQKKAEEQLRRLAHYDPLTGLPNRLSLQKDLGRLLAGDDHSRSVSLALFDLDGFKDVNDTLGHSTGDELLIEVGERLRSIAEAGGHVSQVFRLGGDEFVAVIPQCGDPRRITEIVEGMLKQIAEPIAIDEQMLHVGASAGVAIAPNDGATADELIANADLAFYQAKADGGRVCRFFLPVLRARAQARHGLGVQLRRAFSENEFELYFQPQVRLIDKAIIGAEALLRWRHPTSGILAPGAFIDTLAENSIAPEVGKWIIKTACEKASEWRAKGFPIDRIGVNLFPVQMQNDLLLGDIDEILRETGLPAEALELEITENVALNYDNAVRSLQKLHDKGVKLAFDDFGTGYASLSNLTRFPISRIKIDRSFIGKITNSPSDSAIVRSLIAMAHNLGLKVIAEGVETSAQAEFLLNERCEEAQGFLYAKPVPAVEFESYLKAAYQPDRLKRYSH